MLQFVPVHPGRNKAPNLTLERSLLNPHSVKKRSAIPKSTAYLSSDAIREATRVFCERADGSIEMDDLESMFTTLNLLPPSSFNVGEALESVGARIGDVSLEAFLYLVNGVWMALDEQVSHEALVKNTYEAFQRLQVLQAARGDAEDAVTSVKSLNSVSSSMVAPPAPPRAPTKSTFAHGLEPRSSDALDDNSAPPEDPITSIVSSNVHRGFRSLQQFLSPAQGEPEWLKSFIRLGARDNGAGYTLEMSRMQARCEANGISTQDSMALAQVFDSDYSGEIDYDEFLDVMKSDLDRYGLKPRLLEQLRKLLFGLGDAKHSSATQKANVAARPSVVSHASTAAVAGVSNGTSTTSATAVSSSPRRQSRAVSGGAPGDDAAFADEPFGAPFGDGGTGDDAFDAGLDDGMMSFADISKSNLGRSLFRSASIRHASIHELRDQIPLYAMNPLGFYTKIQEDLVRCQQDLEQLRMYEADARRLHKRGSLAEDPDLLLMQGGAATGTLSTLASQLSASDLQHQQTSGAAYGSPADNIPESPTASSVPSLPPLAAGSPRPYGRGHNPLIPQYRYGIPPPPLPTKHVPRPSPRSREVPQVHAPVLLRRNFGGHAHGYAPCPISPRATATTVSLPQVPNATPRDSTQPAEPGAPQGGFTSEPTSPTAAPASKSPLSSPRRKSIEDEGVMLRTASSVLGRVQHRELELKQQMFERELASGSGRCGAVVDAALKRHPSQAQAVYDRPVPQRGLLGIRLHV